MKHHDEAGFTLVELSIALTLTALVAVGALTALDTFAEADRRATKNMEETVGIGRALQMVRRDVSEATALTLTATEWVITRRDGTGVAYAIAGGGIAELHRFQASTPAAAAASAQAAAVAAIGTTTYSSRGHLKDSDYRASAILQGVKTITGTALAQGGTTLGINVVVTSSNRETTQCLAMSISLLEVCKSAAATGSSEADAGGGLLGGLSGLLNGLGK